MDDKRQFTTAEAAMSFLQAGKATITLVSLKSQTRYTYRVVESKDGRVFFVSVLYGPNNESDYAYIGVISAGVFRWTKKSKVTTEDKRWTAFNWAYNQLSRGLLPDTLQVWHEGSCGRCGAKLTVPESIDSGYGPECVRLKDKPKTYRPSRYSRQEPRQDPNERRMQEMEAEADRAQTAREEAAKARVRYAPYVPVLDL